MSKFTLSAFADEYADDFEEQLRGLNTLEIGSIELRFVNKKNISLLDDEELSNVSRLLDKYSVKVSAIGSPLGKIELDGDLDAHWKLCRRVCYIAKTLGADKVRMFSFYPPSGKKIEDCRDQVMAGLTRMLDIADEYGVTLCHENEGNTYGERPELTEDVLAYFGGRLGCVFDMGNYTLKDFDPLDAYARCEKYIRYFHIKDATSGAILPPGEGNAKIEEILKDYTDKHGSVTVSLEPHLQVFGGFQDLVHGGFDNPFVYKSQEEAFTDATERLRKIIDRIG